MFTGSYTESRALARSISAFEGKFGLKAFTLSSTEAISTLNSRWINNQSLRTLRGIGLINRFVFFAPSWINNANEHERFMTCVANGLFRIRWNVNGISRFDRLRFVIDEHLTVARQDVIHF